MRAIRDGQAASTRPVLDLSDRVSQAAASRACSGSPSRPTARALRRTTPTTTATPRSTSTRCAAGVADPSTRRDCSSRRAAAAEPQRRSARVRSRRLPLPRARRRRRRRRRRAPATRRAATASRSTRCSARSCASTRRRRGRPPYTVPADNPFVGTATRGPRSGRTACATRGGSRSTARPATSGSATSARTSTRRSTALATDGRDAGKGVELRLEPPRGRRTRYRGSAPDDAVPPVYEIRTTTARARSPAATCTAARRSRLAATTSSATTATAPSGCSCPTATAVRDATSSASRRSGVSSFGQANDGELYVLSHHRRHLPARPRLTPNRRQQVAVIRRFADAGLTMGQSKTTVRRPWTRTRCSTWAAHGAGEHDDLEVAAASLQVLDRVAVADAHDVLVDDRAIVELRGGVVRGDADDLHAALVRLVVRPCRPERGQERVVDVDDALGPARDRTRRSGSACSGRAPRASTPCASSACCIARSCSGLVVGGRRGGSTKSIAEPARRPRRGRRGC